MFFFLSVGSAKEGSVTKPVHQLKGSEGFAMLAFSFYFIILRCDYINNIVILLTSNLFCATFLSFNLVQLLLSFKTEY